jgi:DNA-binding transcriptional MerR regulator
MSYSIGQLAALAGVSVRTLHHYDRIGLLVPRERSGSGEYRRYDADDASRLHRILSYRELGLSLKDIATLLDDPGVDELDHLRRQERLVRERIARLGEMVAAINLAKEAMTMKVNLTPEERYELFGDFDPAEHEAEAEERWGGDGGWEESKRRTDSYSADEWRRINAEGLEIVEELIGAMAAGEAADGERAMAAAERSRNHISRYFYECSPEMYAALGEMYLVDDRFRQYYEAKASGLAEYVSRAATANSERASGR